MMNVKELSVGNYIWHRRYQEAATVKQIHVDGKDDAIIWFNEGFKKGTKFYSGIDQLEGIDITTQFLEDIGFFERVMGLEWAFQLEIFHEDTNDEQGVRLVWSEEHKAILIETHSKDENQDFDDRSHFYITKVTQIHQLQNLFLCLNGTSLFEKKSPKPPPRDKKNVRSEGTKEKIWRE